VDLRAARRLDSSEFVRERKGECFEEVKKQFGDQAEAGDK
jgi:hypothetical protein